MRSTQGYAEVFSYEVPCIDYNHQMAISLMIPICAWNFTANRSHSCESSKQWNFHWISKCFRWLFPLQLKTIASLILVLNGGRLRESTWQISLHLSVWFCWGTLCWLYVLIDRLESISQRQWQTLQLWCPLQNTDGGQIDTFHYAVHVRCGDWPLSRTDGGGGRVGGAGLHNFFAGEL